MQKLSIKKQLILMILSFLFGFFKPENLGLKTINLSMSIIVKLSQTV